MKVAVCIAIALVFGGTAQGAQFWPLLPGSTLTYSGGVTVEIVDGEAPGQVGYLETGAGYFVGGGYAEGVDGDIYNYGGTAYYQGGFDPDFWGGAVPVKFLDLPLYVGKSWANSYPENNGQIVIGSVDGSGTLTTPLGDLEYFEVTIWGVSSHVDGTYFLNAQYGPVRLRWGNTLVGATGTIPVEAQSWGSVKSLFR